MQGNFEAIDDAWDVTFRSSQMLIDVAPMHIESSGEFGHLCPIDQALHRDGGIERAYPARPVRGPNRLPRQPAHRRSRPVTAANHGRVASGDVYMAKHLLLGFRLPLDCLDVVALADSQCAGDGAGRIPGATRIFRSGDVLSEMPAESRQYSVLPDVLFVSCKDSLQNPVGQALPSQSFQLFGNPVQILKVAIFTDSLVGFV